MSSQPAISPGAIFLSYAREDADAARRIADALRAFGVEVWFDQAELRGGDAWDAKIKKQIRECALFLPVISACTQDRPEGYFRREWKLAVERTSDMAAGVAFIVPVVIDDTAETDAAVPEEFMRVQWTRLPHGVPSSQFVDQVKQLLYAPRKATAVGRGTHRDAQASSLSASAAEPRHDAASGRKRSLFAIGGTVLVAVVAGTIYFTLRPVSKDGASAAAAKATPVLSPARQLTAKSATLHDQRQNALRSDLELAEQLCKQAVALDPNDGEVWAEYSLVSSTFIAQNIERDNARRALARTQAERAVRLAPDSNEARFALAYSYRWQNGMAGEAERLLRELVARVPNDKRVLRALANSLRVAGKNEDALVYYARAMALPGGDPLALFQRSMALAAMERRPEALASVEESIALHPFPAAYVQKIYLLLVTGDLEQARSTLAKVPPSYFVEDRCALVAAQVWAWSRQPDQSVNALRGASEYIADAYYRGPKSLLTGDAHRIASRHAAAAADWRAALQLVNERLVHAGNDAILHLRKAELLARLGEKEEAGRSLRTFEELGARAGNTSQTQQWIAQVNAELGKADEAIRILRELPRSVELLDDLRYDSGWDALRKDPRFAELIAETTKR